MNSLYKNDTHRRNKQLRGGCGDFTDSEKRERKHMSTDSIKKTKTKPPPPPQKDQKLSIQTTFME